MPNQAPASSWMFRLQHAGRRSSCPCSDDALSYPSQSIQCLNQLKSRKQSSALNMLLTENTTSMESREVGCLLSSRQHRKASNIAASRSLTMIDVTLGCSCSCEWLERLGNDLRLQDRSGERLASAARPQEDRYRGRGFLSV